MEFMIDTGCQVTILATSVFERPSDTVSAASMWTPVDISGFVPFDGTRGTGYDCCFSGTCNMVLVVASLGSEGLLGTEALQSCLPHQHPLISRVR